MLVQLTRANVITYEPRPVGLPRRVRSLIRFLRRRALELTAGGLVVAWCLQMFATWVGVLQDVALLGEPR